MSDRRAAGRWLAIAASVVIVATLVMAIVAMGPPSVQRQARLDGRRVQDLQRIVQAINAYVIRHDALPTDLATVAAQPGWRMAIVDPQGGKPYAYQVTGARAYRVCAVFNTDTAQPRDGAERWADDDWNHGRGRQCFDRKTDKR